MTQQTPFFEPPTAMDTLEAIVTLESEIARLRAINAELLEALKYAAFVARPNGPHLSSERRLQLNKLATSAIAKGE